MIEPDGLCESETWVQDMPQLIPTLGIRIDHEVVSIDLFLILFMPFSYNGVYFQPV